MWRRLTTRVWQDDVEEADVQQLLQQLVDDWAEAFPIVVERLEVAYTADANKSNMDESRAQTSGQNSKFQVGDHSWGSVSAKGTLRKHSNMMTV